MASITTQFSIIDRISAPMQNMTSAIQQTLNVLDQIDTATQNGFDSSAIDSSRQSVDAANVELIQMQENLEKNRRSRTEKYINT